MLNDEEQHGPRIVTDLKPCEVPSGYNVHFTGAVFNRRHCLSLAENSFDVGIAIKEVTATVPLTVLRPTSGILITVGSLLSILLPRGRLCVDPRLQNYDDLIGEGVKCEEMSRFVVGRSKLKLRLTMRELSALLKIVGSLDIDDAPQTLEKCLRLMEAIGFDMVQSLDDFELTNLVSGSSAILSKSPFSILTAERLFRFVDVALQRNFELMHSRDLSRLLWSIGMIVSTQSTRSNHTMIKERRVQQLIDYGMTRMRREIKSVSSGDLANLVWAYAEWNKVNGNLTLRHSEILGEIVAITSSTLQNKELPLDRVSNGRTGALSPDDLCKLAYAVTTMNLDASEFIKASLVRFKADSTFIEQCGVLGVIRLLYSIAETKSFPMHILIQDRDDLVKECIGFLKERGNAEILSPRHFALMVWSLGQVCEDKAPMCDIPAYTRDDINLLSSVESLRLVSKR